METESQTHWSDVAFVKGQTLLPELYVNSLIRHSGSQGKKVTVPGSEPWSGSHAGAPPPSSASPAPHTL